MYIQNKLNSLKNIFVSILLSGFVICAFGQKAQEVIRVNTQNTCMVFTASEGEKVIFQHFGEQLSSSTDPIFMERPFSGRSGYRESYAPEMYPAYGGHNYLEPALRLTHNDGVFTTDLVYVSHKTIKQDNNVTETVISLKDKLYPVFVDIHLKAYFDENIIFQNAVIRHEEKGGLKVENIASAYLSFHTSSSYLTHFTGTWAAEMQLIEEKLTPGIKRIESKKGVQTTQSENPAFLLSLNGPARENSGEVYGGALAWSGNYQLTFEIDETGELHVISGINPFASTYSLPAGQTFSTPGIALTYSAEGTGQLSRNFHDWSRKYVLPHSDQPRSIVLNSWEGVSFWINEETVIGMMDDAAELGIEMFVLDDGWFGNKYPRNNDEAGLGDWQTNKQKLPKGIAYLADYAVAKGLKFGIWIEPEMVNPESELAKNHPEWVVQSGKRELLPMRHQWLLDLTNPKVQDFIVKTFDDVCALSPNISYIKWDANRYMENAGSTYLPPDKQTHFWIDYTHGLYSVYERIRAKHPDIVIQLCSSGGGRLDFGALRYHDEFWASDNTNALNRIFIQYATNLFFPAIATASHVSHSPNWQTGMTTSLKFRFDVAMSGKLGLELNPKDMSGDDRLFAKKAFETYKQIRPMIQFGDLYRLVSPYEEGGWAVTSYVSKNKQQAVVFAYSTQFHEQTKFLEFKLNGLDPAKKYKITELNTVNNNKSFWGNDKTFTGEELMKVGIHLNIKALFDSAVFLLSEI